MKARIGVGTRPPYFRWIIDRRSVYNHQVANETDAGKPHSPDAASPQIEAGTSGAEKAIWGPWQTVGFGAAIFSCTMAAQTAVAVAFFVLKMAANPARGLPDFASLATNGVVISLAILASTIIGVGITYVFIKLRRGAGFKDYLGLTRITGKTVLVLLGATAALIVISEGADTIFVKSDNTLFMIDAYGSSGSPLLLGVALVVFAPAFEEIFFRGFLFVGLAPSRIGPARTIILTAVMWSLLHVQYDIFGMATILVMGIFLGIVRLKTGSLWSTLLIHSFWNLVAVVETGLAVNGIIN